MTISRKPLIFTAVAVAAVSVLIITVLSYSGNGSEVGNGTVGGNDEVNEGDIENGDVDDGSEDTNQQVNHPLSCDARLTSAPASLPSAGNEGADGQQQQLDEQFEEIGNTLDISLTRGRSTITIADNNQMASFRFTAKYSGNVSELAVYTTGRGNQTLLTGIQEDKDGIPSGEWLVSDGYGSIDSQRGAFVTATLLISPYINAGNVYHIVVQPAGADDKGDEAPVPAVFDDPVMLSVYVANGLAQPYNHERPDSVWPDPSMNSLFFDGELWKETHKWPDFVVKYSDGRLEGQPYTLNAPWAIFGSRYVGQIVEPTYDYMLHKFAFTVGARATPTDSLCYEIRDWDDNVLAAGRFAGKGELSAGSKVWHEVELESDLLLMKGERYRIVLFAPGTDADNGYEVFGHEFGYDSDLGYGGTDIQLTISYDGGESWRRWDDADTVFSLTVSQVAG